MEFKSIDSLSITECCKQLNLRRKDLPEAIQNLTDLTERDRLLIAQLELLLSKDKSAIESCGTIEQYKSYLRTDGLYRNYAKTRIAQLQAEAEEYAFYTTHKDSISGCEEYLQKYPKGKFVNDVQPILLQKKKTDEFNTEFNHYYGNQRYPEAFAICLRYLNEVDDKTKVIEKANSVIPKLSNRIQIPPEVPSISYDWLIDQLVLKGYGKMKYDGSSLKWKMSVVQIFSNGKATEIVSKCRINLFFRIVLLIILCFATAVVFPLSYYEIMPYFYIDSYTHLDHTLYFSSSIYDFYSVQITTLSVVLTVLFFSIWTFVFETITKLHKTLLREIANVIVKHLSK